MALEYVIRYAGERINDFAGMAIQGGSCDLEAGAFGSLTLQLPASHPMARNGAFAKKDATREVTLSERYGNGDEAELFRGWVTDTSLDRDLTLTVECEGMLAYLTRTVVRPYSCTAVSGLPTGTQIINEDPFVYLVEQHNAHAEAGMDFQVGSNPHVGYVIAGTDWKTTWEEMNDKFCTNLDRFLYARSDEWGNRVLYLLDGGAGEGTQAIVVGENVIEMDLDEASRDMVTAIIPRGTTDDPYNEGAGERVDRREIGVEGADVGPLVGGCSTCLVEGDRVVNWDMVEAYGYKEEKRDYELNTAEDLARAAASDLDPVEIEDREIRAFDVTAVDLHATNPDVQPIRILDWTEVFIRAEGLEDDGAKGRLIFHGWLPCTRIHIDLGDPARSEYHFGDLQQTFTRKSALRLGMLRRGNGTLVRRTDPSEWNNDRFWNHDDSVNDRVDDVNDRLDDTNDRLDDTNDELDDFKNEVPGIVDESTSEWGKHLEDQFDEDTRKWFESLDEAKKENAEGREELLKHMDEIEGKWGDDLNGLGDKVDDNHRTLLDGIRDVAENCQRTFFGICTTATSTSAKSVLSANLTRPGGEEFVLAKGVVVDVLFQHAHSGAATLDIAATGAKTIVTNGVRFGIWQDGEVIRFLYDGTYWQSCSTDIYGKSVTVGNPAQANFYTNGNELDLRIGQVSYWHAGMTGQRVGLLDNNHIDVGSNQITFEHQSGSELVFKKDSGSNSALIHSDTGIKVDGGYTSSTNKLAGTILSLFPSGIATLSAVSELQLLGGTIRIGGLPTAATPGKSLEFWMSDVHMNGKPVFMRSFVVDPGGHSYIDVALTSSLSGYAFCATNGDINAQNQVIEGTAVGGNAMLTVNFRDAVSGKMRINILGVPVGTIYSTNDPGLPGPSLDGSGVEGPSFEGEMRPPEEPEVQGEPEGPEGTWEDPIVNEDPFPGHADPPWLTAPGARPPWEAWAEAQAKAASEEGEVR